MAHPDEDDDDAELDREDPDQADIDPDESEATGDTEPCPYCRKPVWDQADICPHCGTFVSFATVRRRKPLWLILTVAICILIVLLCWVLTRFKG